MMLQAPFTASRAAKGCAGGHARTVSLKAFRAPHGLAQHSAALVAATALILTPAPARAVLPEGFKSPSTANDPEQLYEQLIEKRTGKEEALPELVDVPEVKAAAKAVVPVAPMAPAIVEPPTPPTPAIVETPVAATAAEVSPIRAAALAENARTVQASKEIAGAASQGGNNGLLIGGGVAALLAVAVVAARGSGDAGTDAAAAPPAAPATPDASEAAAAPAADVAGVSGGAPAENPSSKME